MITLYTLIKTVSEDQKVQVTYTDEVGNNYTVYDGEAGMLNEEIDGKTGDIGVKELNVQSGGILWIDVDVITNGAVKWLIENILANYED